MKLIYLIPLLPLILLVSCGDKKDEQKEIDPLYGNLPDELIQELQKIGPEMQRIEIDPTVDQTIVSDSGTMILIPANTIVDEKGDPVTSPVNLEFKEHFSKSDYVLSNLQTVHNGELLESGGMIYINAYDQKGQELKIAEDKSIRVQMKSRGVDAPKIFLGERNESGQMNWGEYEEPSRSLVAYPILYVSQHRQKNISECPEYYWIYDEVIDGWMASRYIHDDIMKYENTLLATREFKERYNMSCSPEMVRLYIDNIDKNMWEVDELMIKKLIEDSIDVVRRIMKGKEMPESLDGVFHDMYKSELNYYKLQLDQWRNFASQKLEKVDSTFSVDTLELKEYKESYGAHKEMLEARAAFNALEFGWFNLDIFYNDPNAKETELFVDVNVDAHLMYLILKDRSLVISLLEQNGKYVIPDQPVKLPIGGKVSLVGISYLKNKVLFGAKEITIGQDNSENLVLKEIQSDELKKRLERI